MDYIDERELDKLNDGQNLRLFDSIRNPTTVNLADLYSRFKLIGVPLSTGDKLILKNWYLSFCDMLDERTKKRQEDPYFEFNGFLRETSQKHAEEFFLSYCPNNGILRRRVVQTKKEQIKYLESLERTNRQYLE